MKSMMKRMAVAMMEMSSVSLSLILTSQSTHPDEIKKSHKAHSSVSYDV